MTDKLPKSFQGTLPRNSDMHNSRETRQSNLLYVPEFSLRFAQKLPGHILASLKRKKFQRYPEIVPYNNPRCLECYHH